MKTREDGSADEEESIVGKEEEEKSRVEAKNGGEKADVEVQAEMEPGSGSKNQERETDGQEAMRDACALGCLMNIYHAEDPRLIAKWRKWHEDVWKKEKARTGRSDWGRWGNLENYQQWCEEMGADGSGSGSNRHPGSQAGR